jgi:hypothetical protein
MAVFSPFGQSFSTGPRRLAWLLPIALLNFGILPLLVFPGRADVRVVCGLLAIAGLVVSGLLLMTRIRIADGWLTIRYHSPRTARIRLHDLLTVTTRSRKPGSAPVLEMADRNGAQASVHLGTWRREDQLLTLIAQAADRARATVNADAAEILRDRPPAEYWAVHVAAGPPTRFERWSARIPVPFRWILQVAISLVAIFGLFLVLSRAASFSETVLFPRHVDAAWAAPVGVVTNADTWVGNVVVTGPRIVLATREEIDGFWGTLVTRWSNDGGASWSAPIALSGGFDAARHTLVAGPDGSVFAAWSKRGPQPVTQRLVLRRSLDGGASWGPETVVAVPQGGTVGIPALVMSGPVRVIAYTDGVTGQIWSQPLDVAGAADGSPTPIDRTARQLYSDAVFADGGLSIVAVGPRAVLAFVRGGHEVRTAVSDDSGRTWRQTEVNQDLSSGRPRLATDGAIVALAASDPSIGSRAIHSPFIRIWRSIDAGATWDRGPDVTDVAGLGSLDLTWGGGRWRLLYEACPGFLGCATDPRIWYAATADVLAWPEPGAVSEPGAVAPIGIAADDRGVAAFWATLHSTHDWDVVVSRRAND